MYNEGNQQKQASWWKTNQSMKKMDQSTT